MKLNFNSSRKQAQDFFLRLFVEPASWLSTPSDSYYTGAHCGTFARMHQ